MNMNVNQKLYDSGFNFISSKFVRLGAVLLIGMHSYLHEYTCMHSLSLTHVHTHTHTHTLTHLGFIFCALSWVCGAVLAVFDKVNRKEKNDDKPETIKKTIEKKQMTRFERFLSNIKQFFSDIIHFPFRLWLVFIICVFYYVTVFPFIALAT